VAQVEFFDGATSLNVDTTAPFTFAWTPGAAGTHALTAVATDDQGATTRSAAVSVNVVPAGGADTQPPIVALTSPADLAVGLRDVLTLSASATDNVGVVGVEFQIDGQPVASEVTSPPYSVTVNSNLYSSGQHIIRARARDAAGNVSTWARITVSFLFGRRMPTGFSQNESWVTGMVAPTAFAQAPDGRFFVSEKDGRLRVIKNGVLLPTAFHQFTVHNAGERGLLGVAFHPDFASNGYVYVFYTATTPSFHNRIVRLVANGDVSTGAETPIADLPNLGPSTFHNGGALHFGPDGKLYASVGENGVALNAPNLAVPFGKVLRFNDDGTIPTDNPFYGSQTGLARAVWAYGLRNPFTFAFQPGTGRMHIHDVGGAVWEEINLGAPGANYGWPSSEGFDRVTAGITAPVYAYHHDSGFVRGAATVGGAFYPASGNFPAAYRNSYFFADYGGQWVSRLDTVNDGDVYHFTYVNGSPVGVLVGADGALYVLKLQGSITRISAP
jgi:glucose/arabinose dehydrogenase